MTSKKTIRLNSLANYLLTLALCGAALACVAGCGGSKSEKDFVPAQDAARQSLEASLKAWQEGQGMAAVKLNDKELHIEDVDWKAGRKLKSFEIVKEIPTTGAVPRQFSVKITLEGAPPREVTYFIFGPTAGKVFREDDFKRLSGA